MSRAKVDKKLCNLYIYINNINIYIYIYIYIKYISKKKHKSTKQTKVKQQKAAIFYAQKLFRRGKLFFAFLCV